MAALTALAGYVHGSWGEQIYSLMAAASSVGLLLLIPVVASLGREEAQPLAVASGAELPLQKLG
jgi:MFS transporter, PPP family, 3-phenylpropionic acid transporter